MTAGFGLLGGAAWGQTTPPDEDGTKGPSIWESTTFDADRPYWMNFAVIGYRDQESLFTPATADDCNR